MLLVADLNSDALRDLAIHQLMVERNFLDWLPVSVGYVYLGASVLLCILRPKLGFLLIVGSFFFRFQDRLPPLAQFPIFFMQLGALAVGIGMAHQQLNLQLARVDKWLLGFAAISSVGVLLRHQDQFVGEMTSYISSLAVFFASRWLITTKAELHRVMWVMAAAISCLAFEAFYAVRLQQGPHPFWLEFETGAPSRLQSIGYFANPNDFGFILNVGFALWLSIFFYAKRLLLKTLYLLLMALNVYVVTLTLSRSQLMTSAMVVALAWVLLSKGNVFTKMVSLTSVFVLILGVATYVPSPIKDRLDTMKSGPDESMEGRFSSWEEGLHMLRSYPIFGFGRQQWGRYHSLAAHNGYVQTLGETGLTGSGIFIGFLWVLIQPLLKFNRLSVALWHDKRLFMGPIMILACLLWVWMLGNVTYVAITYLMFGMVAALGRLINQSVTTEVALPANIPGKSKFRSQWLDRSPS